MALKGIHGGDIYRNRVRIDFSVNINPLGIPEAVESALYSAVAECGNYPDIEARGLYGAVGAMLKVPEEYLLFGNGASELFMACVHAIKPQKTVIPVPSFYGYEYAAGAAGGEIIYYEMKKEDGFLPGEEFLSALTPDINLLFLANPGNPSGTLLCGKFMERLLSHCGKQGICVVLDECFIEFCTGNPSMLAKIKDFDQLILVRAFTKIFAIPGVRLGYLVCANPRLLGKIARQLPEWNLSAFAQAAGRVCALQESFPGKSADYVAKERQFLADGLKRLGITVFPGAANFLLIYKKEKLYDKLLEKGILIRDCGNFRGLSEGYYRIAVKSRMENEALLKAMGEIM